MKPIESNELLEKIRKQAELGGKFHDKISEIKRKQAASNADLSGGQSPSPITSGVTRPS
jgi:hypothetical protein